MKQLLTLIAFLLGQFICSAQVNNEPDTYSETLDKMQGLWRHSQDTLATINIKGNMLTYGYKSEMNISEFDSFTISLKDTVFNGERIRSQILILTRPKENEKYEILGLTDTTLSVLDLSRGRINLYFKDARSNRR